MSGELRGAGVKGTPVTRPAGEGPIVPKCVVTVVFGLFVVCLVCLPADGVAQDVNATPASSPAILVGLAGIQDAVARDFEASGFRPVGTLVFRFGVAEFDTPEHAEEAIPRVLDR